MGGGRLKKTVRLKISLYFLALTFASRFCLHDSEALADWGKRRILVDLPLIYADTTDRVSICALR